MSAVNLMKIIIKSLSYGVSLATTSLLSKKASLVIWDQIISGVQSATSSFLTYHQRPKCTGTICPQSEQAKHLPLLAIVMQGPIIIGDDFTLETLKMYKKHFPNALLILSTWNSQSPKVLDLFIQLDIQVVINAMPDFAGHSNINLQIVSTKSGIQRARELGAEYVLKTRTDHRMYAPNIEECLYNITQLFPVRSESGKQRERIVGCSLNTFKFRMYGLSDMFLYGHIEDMWIYWNVELDRRAFTKDEINKAQLTLESFSRWRVCEIYLTTEFLIKVGRHLNWTLADSWLAFSDNFCVIDCETLDLFWNKYNQREFRWLGYDGPQETQQLNFREWLNLYCN